MARPARLSLLSAISSMARPQPRVTGDPSDPATGAFIMTAEDGQTMISEDGQELLVEEAFFVTPHQGGRR